MPKVIMKKLSQQIWSSRTISYLKYALRITITVSSFVCNIVLHLQHLNAAQCISSKILADIQLKFHVKSDKAPIEVFCFMALWCFLIFEEVLKSQQLVHIPKQAATSSCKGLCSMIRCFYHKFQKFGGQLLVFPEN